MVVQRTLRTQRSAPTRPPGRTDPARPGAGDPRRRFADLLLAALTGQCSATRLLGMVSGEVYERLWTLAQEGALPHRQGMPGPRVLTCRHCQPSPGVLEVSAVVRAAGRVRALAFRLESGTGRKWRCTALEVG